MFCDEIYDPILEELRSISETMKELEKLISQQISIENANNFLLRKLLENPNDRNLGKSIESIDVDKYLYKDILFINSSQDETIKNAKKIATGMEGEFIISEAKSDSELAALINGLSNGDIVFVDVSEPFFDKKMGKVLYDCIKDKCINILIGKGPGARSVRLDIPEVYFYVYTYMEELLPNGIKELLTYVE